MTTEPIYGKQCRDEKKTGAYRVYVCGKCWSFQRPLGFSVVVSTLQAPVGSLGQGGGLPWLFRERRCETSLREWGWVAKAFPRVQWMQLKGLLAWEDVSLEGSGDQEFFIFLL